MQCINGRVETDPLACCPSAYSAYSAVALTRSLPAEVVSASLCHDAFDLHFGVMAKVDQQAQFEAGRLEIVFRL